MKKLLSAALIAAAIMTASPAVGDKAKDFELSSMDGSKVRLAEEMAKGPVVLIALRGFPGYQCPFCSRQVNEFIKSAAAFQTLGVEVILVYPGPPDKLNEHAREFTAGKTLPANFVFLLDPAYTFTNMYGLRWDAPQETAYPSTFVMDQQGTIFFSKISTTHGERSTPAEVLAALKKRAEASANNNQ